MSEPPEHHIDDGLGIPGGDVAPIIPELIIERVGSCVRFVHSAIGLELDFAHETLPLLDHYLITARKERETRPETVPLLIEAMGAYFGQVLAREFGGFWRVEDNDSHNWLLCFHTVFLAINPIGVAHDALFDANKHDGPSSELLLAREDSKHIEERFASLPEVSEQDFYTFSTRFDAVHIALEGLRAQMLDAGTADTTYEWGDYEDELRRRGA